MLGKDIVVFEASKAQLMQEGVKVSHYKANS